jgi:endonuclease/exonuclease/phosphatase family metal-dependent hydrolase
MRVLTWNLYHGRSVPPAARDLEQDFAAALAAWPWDVALLQEVPPWWPAGLARAAGADQRTALTSRNALLPLRRAIARRWPDVIKSGGGGANAILVRGTPIVEHRTRRLRLWPERRVVHAARLEGGLWVANLHAQVHSDVRACADIALAAATVLSWAGDAPVVLGGDLNVRDPGTVAGFVRAGGHGVDHLLVRGIATAGGAHALDRGPLSDHAPVLVELQV